MDNNSTDNNHDEVMGFLFLVFFFLIVMAGFGVMIVKIIDNESTVSQNPTPTTLVMANDLAKQTEKVREKARLEEEKRKANELFKQKQAKIAECNQYIEQQKEIIISTSKSGQNSVIILGGNVSDCEKQTDNFINYLTKRGYSLEKQPNNGYLVHW